VTSTQITGLITAIGAIATALTALVGVVRGLKQSRQNGAGIAHVKDLVNARSDRQDARIEQLTGTLDEANVSVPDRPEVK
jgi:methyl-accepting chemotaxis protein